MSKLIKKNIGHNSESSNDDNKNIIKYIDLCCGIGGFRIALENYGNENNLNFQCVLSADIKDDAIKTYNLNFKHTYARIRTREA